jgi:hypothetical protein
MVNIIFVLCCWKSQNVFGTSGTLARLLYSWKWCFIPSQVVRSNCHFVSIRLWFPWSPRILLHLHILRYLLIIIPTLDVLRPDVLPLSLLLVRSKAKRSKGTDLRTPLLIRSQIASVALSYALQFQLVHVSQITMSNVHLEAERRCEHNTKEDIVSSEEEAIERPDC